MQHIGCPQQPNIKMTHGIARDKINICVMKYLRIRNKSANRKLPRKHLWLCGTFYLCPYFYGFTIYQEIQLRYSSEALKHQRKAVDSTAVPLSVMITQTISGLEECKIENCWEQLGNSELDYKPVKVPSVLILCGNYWAWRKLLKLM